ncbi:hypothetical protein EWH99_13410 [Sporolactobacillus sp. THM7-7]|nr:hypothetical protein EWH99_13410 [Sporolactobacillus sp. THM7-7]
MRRKRVRFLLVAGLSFLFLLLSSFVPSLSEPARANDPTGLRVTKIETTNVTYKRDAVSMFAVTFSDGSKRRLLCAHHRKLTPYDGDQDQYDPLNPYLENSDPKTRQNVIDTLYYGWGGPESIVGEHSYKNAKGITATSLVLSHYVSHWTGWSGGSNGHDGDDRDNDWYLKLKQYVETHDAPRGEMTLIKDTGYLGRRRPE